MDDGNGACRAVRHDCRSGKHRNQGNHQSDTLHDYEVCKYVRLENGNGVDVYNMEVVASLAFRLNTRNAAVLRKWLIATAPKRVAAPIIIQYKEELPN